MQKIKNLPDPTQLRSIMQSLAALDAIYCPEWEYRYYSFDSKWGEHEEMGSIRNGSGDDVFVLFNSQGCFLKGFSHEFFNKEKTAKGFYEGIPPAFISGSVEPAFTPNNVSFCCWRHMDDVDWSSAVSEETLDPNTFFLLECLYGDQHVYRNFVADYYEIEADIEHISSVFQTKPMTIELAKVMNSEVDYSVLLEDLNGISYPVSSK